MEKTDYARLKAYAEITGTLDDYVVLKEDDKGRYIEYAFQDGEPHDNRCLSWYDKLQPEALRRNDHDIEEWSNKLKKVGEIYRLHHMCCGNDDKEGPEHCSAGHPCENCVKDGWAKEWTYDEPVKCACWLLEEIYDLESLRLTLGQADEYIDKCEMNRAAQAAHDDDVQASATFLYGRQTMLTDICEWLSEHASEYAFPIYNGEELTDESYVCDGLVVDLKKAFEVKWTVRYK